MTFTTTTLTFINTVKSNNLFNYLASSGCCAFGIHCYEITGATNYLLSIVIHENSLGGSVAYSYFWSKKVGDGKNPLANTYKTQVDLLSEVPSGVSSSLTSVLSL